MCANFRALRATLFRVARKQALKKFSRMKKLDEKWFFYALGVSAASLTESSQAAIIYTNPPDVTGTSVYFDLDNGNAPSTTGSFSGADFQLSASKVQSGKSSAETDSVFSLATTSGVASYAGSSRTYASKLAAGATIGSNLGFTRNAVMEYATSNSITNSFTFVGPWNPVTGSGGPGFLGLQITLGGQLHYGWAQAALNADSSAPNTFTLFDYAYESDANTPIQAGAKPVPEPSTIALLAAGATGVVALRRRSAKK